MDGGLQELNGRCKKPCRSTVLLDNGVFGASGRFVGYSLHELHIRGTPNQRISEGD